MNKAKDPTPVAQGPEIVENISPRDAEILQAMKQQAERYGVETSLTFDDLTPVQKKLWSDAFRVFAAQGPHHENTLLEVRSPSPQVQSLDHEDKTSEE